MKSEKIMRKIDNICDEETLYSFVFQYNRNDGFENNFRAGSIKYEVPSSRVQKFLYRKDGVNEIFLNGK